MEESDLNINKVEDIENENNKNEINNKEVSCSNELAQREKIILQ